MFISVKWLSEFVELPSDISPKDIAEQLTMAGLEVESAEDAAPNLRDKIIGRVMEIMPHPTKAELTICKVDVGEDVRNVVCGAKNFRENDWVVYAPIHSVLADGTVIGQRKVAGVDSFGMLCSEKELGLSENHSGILIVPNGEDLKTGQNAREALGLDDTIMEIKITPNRPDALCHVGVARELSAILPTRAYFANATVKELGGAIHDVAQVTIGAKDACPRYACRVIEGLSIKESPLWLRMRLLSCGIRPINNVVDVTNLILLERGQPLHAFDWGALTKDRGRALITVRHAKKGEKLTTLDGKERHLTTDDLVIADAEHVLALAGVMGGQNSEVSEKTTTILLESAYFDAHVVRRMARRHVLSTEASYRFERGADPNGVLVALDRATELMVQLCGGRVRRESIDVYPKPITPLEISVRRQRLAEISGLPEPELDEAKIRSRFLLLGIETVGRRGDALSFRVPTFRPDLTREIDLIEEAMRLIGFDKVPTRLAFAKSVSGIHDEDLQRTIKAARHSMTAAGFFEAINFSFGSPQKFALFAQESFPEPIRIDNPLGEEVSVMRQSLLPGLIENILFNARRGANGVQLFEIGTVFLGRSPSGKIPNIKILEGRANQDSWALEKLHVAAVMYGRVGVNAFDRKQGAADYYDLKGALEELLSNLGIATHLVSQHVRFAEPNEPYGFLHPGSSADVWSRSETNNKDVQLGFIGQVHPDVQAAFELKDPIFAFELDMQLLSMLGKEYRVMSAIPKFPPVTRDLALLLDDEVNASLVTDTILADGALQPLVNDLSIFDVYKGDKIGVGKKSLAVSITLRAQDRTLTDDEVAELMKPVMESLQTRLGAQIR